MSFSFVSTEGGTEGFIKTGHLNLSGVLPAAAPEKKAGQTHVTATYGTAPLSSREQRPLEGGRVFQLTGAYVPHLSGIN